MATKTRRIEDRSLVAEWSDLFEPLALLAADARAGRLRFEGKEALGSTCLPELELAAAAVYRTQNARAFAELVAAP